MKISAVIPVYNEEKIIAELCKRTSEALASVSDDYNVIIIDDGSHDSTWQEIEAEAAKNKNVKGIRLSRNFGQHVAITAGLDHAMDSDWVVVMDGDLQDRPEAIPRMLDKAKEGYDIVFVERLERPISPVYRFFQKQFYRILRYLAQTDYELKYGNFSLVSGKVIRATKGFRENIRFYGGMIFWSGFKRTSIAEKHDERFAGKPSYSLFKRLKLAFDIIIAHSERPLYLAIILGLCAMAGSFSYGFYVIFRRIFFGFAVEGWASLMVSIYFIGGMLMCLLGIIGLYVGRIFTQVKNRPLYLTSDKANLDDEDALPPV